MLSTIARTFDFSGTADRRVFWSYFAIYPIALIALAIASELAGREVRAVLIAGVALVALPMPALAVRRLHDSGLNGAWAWLLVFFLPGQLIVLGLALRRTRGTAEWPKRARHIFGRIAVICFAVLIAARLIWEPFYIPSGSMKPTLFVGDYIIVPVWDKSFAQGDVVVFEHPTIGIAFVGRVIGRGGETVEMQDGQVTVTMPDGTIVSLEQVKDEPFLETYQRQGPIQSLPLCQEKQQSVGEICTKDKLTESWANRRYSVLNIFDGRFDNLAPTPVPHGHVFLLGDNRDNASDSRLSDIQGGFGMVPEQNVFGVPYRIVFSSAGRFLWDVTSWRWDRLWKRIE